MIDHDPPCWRCKRKMAKFLTRPWELTCHRCHAQNASEPLDNSEEVSTLKRTS